ncbi:flagellar basal-body rod protein FlgF [Roseibium hamelinense]|uniref:Flagellar basal-body rod protein FlgF n=1 Tax=Roseibium hamelinense TaxID=150831 RepID=A0A562T9W3_9HYPH|nr:flagellar basal-body rod protein FlgF [Roseibium hamelinense]MTI45251.1 flagellar basal-body rod protein FlgF [Roseibium hamelinense]TWI90385.1 flagellar basal-body rod protein FlgF [Roseibium hamelinense]
MENAQLVALSRQTVLRNQLDVVANNMANINTSGYKSQRLLFEEYLMPVAEATEFPTPDEDLSYVHDYASYTNFTAGAIKLSGNEFDLAIEGDAFFAVQLPDGTEAYTRNGAFHLDNQGMLVTSEGQPVLTNGGPIFFNTEDGRVDIARDGTISTELGARGQIRLARFENPQALVQAGDTLFTGEEPLPVANVRVVQGAVEQSNAEGVVEMTRMIEIQRAYTTISKLIKDTDDLRKQAISTLGRLEA